MPSSHSLLAQSDNEFRSEVIAQLQRLQIGQRIKKIREERKLSQSTLARMCRLSQSQIAKIESGITKNPTLETLLKVTIALGMEVKIIFEER